MALNGSVTTLICFFSSTVFSLQCVEEEHLLLCVCLSVRHYAEMLNMSLTFIKYIWSVNIELVQLNKQLPQLSPLTKI